METGWPEDESPGGAQLRNEAVVDHRPRRSVIFPNRVAVGVRHKEVVFRQGESVRPSAGKGRARPGGEVGVNRGSRLSVVFANYAAVEVRHEEVVARPQEPAGAA